VPPAKPFPAISMHGALVCVLNSCEDRATVKQTTNRNTSPQHCLILVLQNFCVLFAWTLDYHPVVLSEQTCTVELLAQLFAWWKWTLQLHVPAIFPNFSTLSVLNGLDVKDLLFYCLFNRTKFEISWTSRIQSSCVRLHMRRQIV
jgi:hypothetical protein